MPRGPRRASVPGAACLRLVTHNVRKQVASRRVELLSHWRDVLRGDVIALQETACNLDGLRDAMHHSAGDFVWHLPHRAHDSAPAGGGVALLVRSSLLGGAVRAGAVWSGPRGHEFDGRVVGLPLRWGGHRLFVVNVYLPNLGQGAWLRALLPHLLDACGSQQLVLLGDFNFVEDPRQDRVRAGTAPPLPGDAHGTAALRDLCPSLIDAYRRRSPGGRQMTHVYSVGASRLDRVYVAAPLVDSVLSCRAGPAHLSDHRAVVAVLAACRPACPAARGPGLRRCRLLFLKCPDLLQQYRDWCHAHVALAPADDDALMEWWLVTFKPALVCEILRLNRASRMPDALRLQPELCARQAAVAAAQARLDAGQADALPDLLAARHALRGALVGGRAPPAWLHVREGPCPLLSAAVAPRAASRAVAALRAPSGFLQPPGRPQAQLMAQHLAAISGPFVPQAAATSAVLTAVSQPAHPRLSEAEAQALDAPLFGEAEVKRALKRLPSGASPGVDGLPLEAYRRAASSFLPLLTRIFNVVGARGAVAPEFLDGAVVSLPKPGAADLADPSSYRPITLLNSDYKLLAKVLANRLLACIGTVVAPTQTGYVPGRHIGSNVLALQLLPQHLAATGRSGVVVFLDTRKAFDTIDRGFLLAVMAAVGVGPRFRAWVALLLGDTRACSVLNGHVSARVRFRAGVRQGCPLSPLLYLFVGEALLRFLSRHGRFGLPLPGGGTLVALQLADDTQVPLAGLHLEEDLLADLDAFGRASNQRVNVDKTTALPVGQSAPLPADPPRTPGGMRQAAAASALGFTFHEGLGPVVPVGGWEVRLQSAFGRLDRLGGQPLTMFGRAMAANAYASSKLLYAAEFSDVPQEVLARWQDALAAFVQCGLTPSARHRQRFFGVRRSLLEGHPSRGGFGLLSLREHIMARQAKWASLLLLDEGGHPWVRLARALLPAPAAGLLGAWPGGAHLPPAVLAACPPAVRRMLLAAVALPAPGLQPLPARPGQPHPGLVTGWRWPYTARVVPATCLTVKAATALLSACGDVEDARDEAFLTFVLALPDGPGRAAVRPSGLQRDAALAPLYATLAALWRLPWSNDYKQVFWRLLYDGLPTAGRLHQSGVCACGLPSAQRRPPNDWHHVFWECFVARAVRTELQRCCPGGSALTRQQLFLMQPPAGVLLEVWQVVCLAALNAMWRCRAQPTARAVTLAAAIQRAGDAVDCFWSLLHDFTRTGRYRQSWRRRMTPAHPFLRFARASAPLHVSRPPVGVVSWAG